MAENLVRVTKSYVVCPHCLENSNHTIDHLIEKRAQISWGPWYCDVCGHGFSGTVFADGTLEIVKESDSFTNQFNLLCIPPQSKPIYLVVSQRHPTGRPWGDTRYYYEEHSCPTNWLKNIQLVSIDGNHDPHGLIKYIDSVAYHPEPDDDPNYDWAETFPQISSGE